MSFGFNFEVNTNDDNIPRADSYQELTDREHILEDPDMYMGKINFTTTEMFTYDLQKVKYENITYNQGAVKLFDEIITNAVDNITRKYGIQNVIVNITPTTISVYNDGLNIPIERNSKGMFIPEMVFTRPKTSNNFIKGTNKNRYTGGKNGYGAKLTVIFSKQFKIDLSDGKQRYTQIISNNLTQISPPNISTCATNPYICITYELDFEKLGMTKYDDGTLKVMYKRVHDMTHLPINVFLNNKQLPRLSWKQFIDSYNISTNNLTYETDGWKVGVGICQDAKFHNISFVNNIRTYGGGTHIDYILDQMVGISKKYISDHKLTVNGQVRTKLKNSMCLYAYSMINNPSFNGQAKDVLDTPHKQFEYKCLLPDSIVNNHIEESRVFIEESQKKAPKPSKIKKGRLTGYDDLDDANKAGTNEGFKCTLLLCEGLSAKTMCDRGMGIIGRDYFGCYPVGGKILNTLNASDDDYYKSDKIIAIKRILGLQDGMVYNQSNINSLRYGRVVCVKDADVDGSSIMGLIINFFNNRFPSLLQIPGFFSEFISPMIKVIFNDNTPRREVIPFYNEFEYKQWLLQHADSRKFVVKFIKGLAGHVKQDVDTYFKDYAGNTIRIDFSEKDAGRWIDAVFNKRHANWRKTWLAQVTPDTYLPRERGKSISIIDFINKDFINFSYDDCVRSIPSGIDGLKPSYRKILFSLFKHGEKSYNPIKVFQMGGQVAKEANYHHGDASMNETIIGLAQDYPTCGNNIPLLTGFGAFGTRQKNGADHGQPRYIECALSKITRKVFPQEDDQLMTRISEDNQLVEPYYYAPIVPMVLINGALGIGTGWSTNIPSFKPKDCIKYVKHLLTKTSTNEISSYYNGFTGSIIFDGSRWKYTGCIQDGGISNKGKTYIVTELPIGRSINDFKKLLNYFMEYDPKNPTMHIVESRQLTDNKKNKKKVEEDDVVYTTRPKWSSGFEPVECYNNKSTDDIIYFEITFKNNITIEQAVSVLGLTSTISASNFVVFQRNCKITKMKTIYDIIKEWFDVRYVVYQLRIESKLHDLKYLIQLLYYKAKFVDDKIHKIIVLEDRPESDVISQLKTLQYPELSLSIPPFGKTLGPNGISIAEVKNNNVSYDYLLNMRIRELTKENHERLINEYQQKVNEFNILNNMTVEKLWLSELDELERYL